jgi:hypothetical protein
MTGLSWLEIDALMGWLGLIMLGIVLETDSGKGFHQELIYA